MANRDAPGNKNQDYGASRGGRVVGKDPFAGGAAPYGKSPWYGRNGETNPMPWAGPDDGSQTVGSRAPRFTPDAADPRNAGYFIADDPAKDAMWQADHDAQVARSKTQLQGWLQTDPELAAAYKAKDYTKVQAAIRRLSQGVQDDKWHGMGMQSPREALAASDRGASGIRPTSALGNTYGPGKPAAPQGGGGGVASPMSAGGGGNVGSQSGGSSMITGFEPSSVADMPGPMSLPGEANAPGQGFMNSLGKIAAATQQGGPNGLSNVQANQLNGALLGSIKGTPAPTTEPVSANPPPPMNAQDRLNSRVAADGAAKSDMMAKINANRARAGLPPL